MPFPSGTYIAQIQDPAVRAEIEQLYALFQGFLQAEHKDSGAHGNVTADSVTVNGTLTGHGLVAIDGSKLTGLESDYQVAISSSRTTGPIVDIRSSVGQSSPTLIIESADNFATGSPPNLHLLMSHPSNVAFFDLYLNTDGSVLYNNSVNGGGATAAKHRFDGSIYERSRTTALGEWADVAFAAGNFTATVGNWTLTSGDQTQFRYTLIGKTMIISYMFDTTSVSANPSQLRFAIPGGFTAAKDMYTSFMYNDNGAGWISGAGTAFTQSGLTFIALQLGTFGVSTWAIAANTTAVRGTVVIEVQ